MGTSRFPFHRSRPHKPEELSTPRRILNWGTATEIALIGIWAASVGRELLDFDPYTWALGREIGSQIQAHHFWIQLKRCGLCALWNGGINGGAPALADVFSSTLHPLVMVPTLLWGVVIGAKVAIVLSLWMAGSAQWWIARLLGLGRVARLWSALIAVVGGHLAGRLETGAFGLVLSTASASLVLAAAINLGLNPGRRPALALALTGAMGVVAGQGYMQLALLSWAPAFLFFVLDKDLKPRPVWKDYLLASGLCLLLASLFLLPLVHFWPNLTKPTDVSFAAAQPLEYIPLNLVIRDQAFLRSENLGKLAFPYMYNLYIGWVPVLLAILWLRLAPRSDLPALLALTCGAALTLFVASAIPLRWLVDLVPGLAGFRFAPLVAGLAIPAILGLAAYGLDRLLKLEWPQIVLLPRPANADQGSKVSMKWLLSLPLLWALTSTYGVSRGYLNTANLENIYAVIDQLKTPDLQWVSPPFGEHFWIEPALEEGLKVSPAAWAWYWGSHQPPAPRLEAIRGAAPPELEVIGSLGDVPIYLHPERTYAYVQTPSGQTPCPVTGNGGELTARCTTDSDGMLLLQENAWQGWEVLVDQEPAPLLPGRWLRVDAPAGDHEYLFRYRPLDVPLGALLTITGLVLTVRSWLGSGLEEGVREPQEADEEKPLTEEEQADAS